MKILSFILLAIFITLPLSSKDRIVTLQGVARETKDGIYVDGVMISDSALPKGQSIFQFVGKKVRVKGIVEEVQQEDPNKGKDPAKDPMVQARVGSWRIMTKVESIQVVP